MYKFYGKTCQKLEQLYMLKANQIIATATWESSRVLQLSSFDRLKADLQFETKIISLGQSTSSYRPQKFDCNIPGISGSLMWSLAL